MTPEELKQNAMIDEAVASAELAMPENEWRDTLVEEVGDCINTDSPKNFTRVQNFIQNLLTTRDTQIKELEDEVEDLKMRIEEMSEYE